MPSKNKYDEYVSRANDAQQQADKAKDPQEAERWLRIAASYRDLAMMAQYASRKKKSR